LDKKVILILNNLGIIKKSDFTTQLSTSIFESENKNLSGYRI